MTKKFSFSCFLAAVSFFPAAIAQTNGPSLFFVPGIVSSLQVGVPVSKQINVSGGTGPYSITATSFPLHGLAISNSGLLTGTPTTATTSTAVVSVNVLDTGTRGATPQTLSLGLSISPAPLLITTASLPYGFVGGGFSTSVTMGASGGTPPYTFSTSAGSLNGLTLNTDGTFTGAFTTPGNPINVSIQVTDSAQTAYVKAYSLRVYDALSILSIPTLNSGIVGKNYGTAQFSATGGSGSYVWSGGTFPAGLAIGAATGAITGTPTTAGFGLFNVILTDRVTGQTAFASELGITIYPALVITGPAALSAGVTNVAYPGTTVTATGTTTASIFTATGLPAGLSFSAAGVWSGTPTTTGSYSVAVTVTEPASGQSAQRTYPISVYAPLSVTSPSAFAAGFVGTAYVQVASTASGGGGGNTWTATGLPAGISIDSKGAISGTPTAGGISQVTITVSDSVSGQRASSSALSFPVYATLTISSPSTLPFGVVNKVYTTTGLVVTGGSGGATFSATGLPSGVAISSAGSIGGTPTVGGTFPVVATATDFASGQTATANFPVVVYKVLQITSPSTLPIGITGAGYGPVVPAATGGSGTVTWSATGLPSPLTIAASSGSIGGTPTTTGNSSVTITVTDSNTGQTASVSNLALQIYQPLTLLNQGALHVGVAGKNYSQISVSASGGSGGTTYTATGLPGGLTIGSAGAISGTPTALGTSAIVVTAADTASGQTATGNYSIQIYGVLSISTPTALISGVVGAGYGPTSATAAGGGGANTWSATGLPSGLTIGAGTGAISGTPAGAGLSTVVITVSDSVSGQTASTGNLSLQVYTVLTISGPATLPFGVLTQAYSGTTVVAAGGSGGATLVATGLPPGLTISAAGAISGTPTAPGAASVVVTATDAVSSQTVTKNYTLTVYDVLKITAPSALGFGVVGRALTPISATTTGGGGTNTWTSTGLPASLTINSGTGSISGTPAATATLSVVITVTDSVTGQTASTAALPLTIYAALTLNVPSPLGPGVNGLPVLTIALSATGGTGNYSFSQSGLPNGLSINATTGAITGTPNVLSAGTFPVSLTVTDAGSAQTVTKSELSLRIYSQISFSGPVVLPFAVLGRPYSGTTVTGTGGSASYQWGFPGDAATYGLSISQSGVLSGTILGNPGTFSLAVTMLDLNSGQQITKVFQLRVSTSPQITGPTTLPYAVTGRPYAGVAVTTSGGAGGFSWTASGLPGGLAIDPSSGTISSQSVTATSGTYPITVTLTDTALNLSVNQNFSLQVYGSLIITTPSLLANGVYNIAYPDTTVSAGGGTGTISWSATGLPSGLQIGNSTGKISGTPSVGGGFTVVVTATDGGSGQTATKTYTLTVAYPPLSISAAKTNLGTVAVGTNVSFPFVAAGGRGPYAWSLSGNAPAGVSITADGILTGSPTNAGNSLFVITLTDAQLPAATTTVTASLGVLGLSSSAVLPNAATFAGYSYTFLASGGVAPYTFTSTGTLPGGLTLAGSGVLSGSPTTSGAFSFPVTVADGNGVKSTASYSLTVAAPTPIVIQSGSLLTDANLGVPYSMVLSANGGNPPYTWALTSGAPPDGLSLKSSGTISGTPLTPGTFSFSVKATDGSGGSATASFSAKVLPSELQITTTELPPGVLGSDYPQQLFAATGGIGPYVFAVTTGSLPTGLTLTNAVLGGTATAGGDFNFTVTVADSANTTATGNFKITIRTTTNDLLLSTSALGFSLTAGSTIAPDPQTVTVKASSQGSTLTYSVVAPLSANWLRVSAGSGTAPSSIQFAVSPAAFALAASPSPVAVAVNCLSGACAGTSQSVTVSLTVSLLPAKLSVLTDLLSYSGNSADTRSATQLLQLRNAGGGIIGVSSIGANAPWCTVGSSTGSIAAGGALPVTVFANPLGLAPGFYRTTVDVVTSAGSASVPVTLLVARDSSVVLSPSGAQFVLSTGGVVGNGKGLFLLSAAGRNAINWTAAAQPGAGWLQVNSASGQAAFDTPSKILYSINAAAAAALPPQAYYGTIRVTSPDAVNSPFDFQVILNVVAANTPVNPDPQPAGLIFLTPAGVSPPPQLVTVYAGTNAASGATYQASATIQTGSDWLTVNPATGTTSAASPAASSVNVNSTGLSPGVYSGGVSYTLSGAGVRTVNVTLVVEAQLSSPEAGGADSSQAASIQTASIQTTQTEPSPKATCAATALAPTQTGLVNNFSAPTSWPTPLAIRLYNDCGAAVPDGQLTVTFSNGDPPLAMPLVDRATALYSATWTPRATSSQVTVTAQARAAGFQDAKALITGSVTPNKAPALAKNGTFHIFYPQVGAALAPGNVVQIYGSALANVTTAPTTIPLPTQLNGTSVIIGGIETPMFFASSGQVNVQIPFELAAGKQYQVVVNANGALTAPGTINIAGVTPGLAAFADGTVIAQHGDGSLVLPAVPAAPGEYVVLYASGMGKTDNPAPSGGASPTDPLARPITTVSLTLDGANVPVAFAGLTPGLVGLYQINFQVPATAKDGNLVLVVSQDGNDSNLTTLPVKKQP